MNSNNLLLPKHLAKFSNQWKLMDKNKRTYKGIEVTGWVLKGSVDSIFCLDEQSRNKVKEITGETVKYLHPKGKGLTPVLFVPGMGVVNHENIDDALIEKLIKEGVAVVEGWKSALALCYVRFNCLAIHGCQGGPSLLEFMKKKSIPREVIKDILADTDVLWNPNVTKAYSKLALELPSAEMSVFPPATFINEKGGLNYTKDSPDDWIEEGFTKEMVYEKTTKINIQIITQQLEKQKNTFLQIQTSVTEKRIKKEMDLDMVHTLREFFVENLFFLPRLNDYYVFNKETCLWSHLDLEELTYFCLNKFEDRNWTFSPLQQGIKSASACATLSWEELQKLFSSKHFIGFENGCWNIKKRQFEPLRKEHYLLSTLPFKYAPLHTGHIMEAAPTICQWLADRVNGSELLTNVLSAALFACILKIEYPERFLFLTGHSATGKSTFFLLLTSLLSVETIYTVSAEDFACDFGLEDLASGPQKSVIIFHDIGGSVTNHFINILRTLVSSTGETAHKRIRRKHKRTGTLRFSGFVCAASNLSPFTGVQAQGIVDRRLLLVPFLKRVEAKQTKNYEQLFPAEERQNLVRLATQVNPHHIRQFLLEVRNHPEMRDLIIEHYSDEEGASALVQSYVTERIDYCQGNFLPYGIRNKVPGTLYYDFEKWKSRQDALIVKKAGNHLQLKQTLLTFIHMNHPNWKGVEDRRRYLVGRSKKFLGITNIAFRGGKPMETMLSETTKPFSQNYRELNWWIKTADPETSQQTSQQTSQVPQTSPENVDEASEPPTNFKDFIDSVNLTKLDVAEAERLRSQLIQWGRETQAEKQETIMLVEQEDRGALEQLKQMFETNQVLALDTEYMPHINPHKRRLCYIQIGGALGDCIFIIGEIFFAFFQDMFVHWLKKPQSLLLGFYLMADLTILSTQFQIAPKEFEWKVFDFYLFFKLLSPQLKKHSLKDWAWRICGIELDKSHQITNWLEEALTEDKKHYMMMDALILLKFLKYLPELEDYDWGNTWAPDCYHDPLCTSIQLDQVLLPLFLEITLKGVFVEETQLLQLSKEFYEKLLENCELLGCTLEQFRSAKKLEQVLSQSSLPGMSECLSAWPRTLTGDLCLRADKLNAFLFGEDLTPECLQWFAQYFQTKKSLSHFLNVDKMAKYLDEGHLFPSWDIFGAATGRIITREPALNSTPRDSIFREMFRATAGHSFIVCDYSMIEIVIMAVISQDATMLENLYEKKDLHMFLASQVLEKPYEQLMAFKQTDPQEYQKIRTPMKSVNFGLLYGMGAVTLWIRLISQGNSYTQTQVQHIHNVWTKTYTGIREYKRLCQSTITQNQRQAPKIPASFNALTSLRGRVARNADTITSTYNFPIQATCADILKTALRLFNKAQQLQLIDTKVRVVLTAHDEIVFQCPTSQVEQVEKQVVALMMATANKILKPLEPDIEVEVESGVGDSWAAKP